MTQPIPTCFAIGEASTDVMTTHDQPEFPWKSRVIPECRAVTSGGLGTAEFWAHGSVRRAWAPSLVPYGRFRRTSPDVCVAFATRRPR